MLKVELLVKNIDPNNILEKIPADNPIVGFLKKIIKTIPSIFLALGTFIFDVPMVKRKIIGGLNELFMEKKLTLKLVGMDSKKVEREGEKMLKLDFLFNELDYESVLSELLRIMLESNLKKDGEIGDTSKYINGLGEVPYNMLKAALETLPQEQKDEIVTNIIRINRNKIVSLINNLAEKNNIKAELSSMNVAMVMVRPEGLEPPI
ncbi:hypothetical protein E9840_01625 [Tissierella creatinini]|nr:hypothetical protein E9840_01625 [Tissierella creatinini]TJX61849.1 hypothetical protein E8P77_18120 [Soehngenia saccharolytica]